MIKINTQFQNKNIFISCFLKLIAVNLTQTQHLARVCLRHSCLSPSFWNTLLMPNHAQYTENFQRECWAPSVTARDYSPHCNYRFIDRCRKPLVYFYCQDTLLYFLVWIRYFALENYPLSAFIPHAVLFGASPIPSSKIDTWFQPEPVRISLSPIHMTGSDRSNFSE